MDDPAFLPAVRSWFEQRTNAWMVPVDDACSESREEQERRQALMSRRGALDAYVLCRVDLVGSGSGVQRTVQRAREHLLFLYEQAGQMATEERALDHIVPLYGGAPMQISVDNHVPTLCAHPQTDLPPLPWAEQLYRSGDAGVEPRRAIRYAQRWWDSRNPDYPQFANDCANFVSQALFAAGYAMSKPADRASGWWFRHGDTPDWSFSWSVAHALVHYLRSASDGHFLVTLLDHARDLCEGDVIAYDWSGDGRYDHVALVTGHDAVGEPLVHAHTVDSADRYWSYEDSTAWTPTTTYLFVHLG
jgi:hypothetical protein